MTPARDRQVERVGTPRIGNRTSWPQAARISALSPLCSVPLTISVGFPVSDRAVVGLGL
jgi:hypothetical protein